MKRDKLRNRSIEHWIGTKGANRDCRGWLTQLGRDSIKNTTKMNLLASACHSSRAWHRRTKSAWRTSTSVRTSTLTLSAACLASTTAGTELKPDLIHAHLSSFTAAYRTWEFFLSKSSTYLPAWISDLMTPNIHLHSFTRYTSFSVF